MFGFWPQVPLISFCILLKLIFIFSWYISFKSQRHISEISHSNTMRNIFIVVTSHHQQPFDTVLITKYRNSIASNERFDGSNWKRWNELSMWKSTNSYYFFIRHTRKQFCPSFMKCSCLLEVWRTHSSKLGAQIYDS